MAGTRLHFEPFFTWVNRGRILFSPGSRAEIAFELRQLGASKPLVITDKGLVGAGVADQILQKLESPDLQIAGLFDAVTQDARIENINKAARFYRDAGADSLIAVGGGSVLDTAKAVNILVGAGLDDFKPLADQAALWEDASPLPAHIAVPTTAGTGCEVTNVIVVLDSESRAKLSVTHPFCNADLSILDPELTIKLPPKITAFTGIDALTHAIEGITSIGAQPISDALGLQAIRMITRALPLAVLEPEDVEARGDMMIAATMAGMCFCNSMLGATHATAHALGALYGIPHGLANAMMLPLVMEFNIKEATQRYSMIAQALGVPTDGSCSRSNAESAVDAVRKLKMEIGLKETLKDFHVPGDPDKLSDLVELAAGDSQISYNPRMMDESDILNLYLRAQ
ncbi:MAG: iron-containing alcohol dehydrogenase [Syntrophaceae bacterium]|nr:iron-containing alcohol dehydrogenase [Syntrophaceae bacterium]